MDSVSETFRKGVCAVVVTHNRLACLKRTLGALRGFGVATVVVDNASNRVGKEVDVEFVRFLQTSAGRMMFAKIVSGTGRRKGQ